VKFAVGEVALKKAFFSEFFRFLSDNHHSTIAPYSFITDSPGQVAHHIVGH
jgi:hypothetical protein